MVHAREELGIDPDDLPSPLLAAFVSFLAFAVGALWPLLPYLPGATSLTPGDRRDTGETCQVVG